MRPSVSFRTYASVVSTASTPATSEAPSPSSPVAVFRPLSLPARVSLDEADFPELAAGGGTSPLRRRRQWRSGRREAVVVVDEVGARSDGARQDEHTQTPLATPQQQTMHSPQVNSLVPTPAPTPASPQGGVPAPSSPPRELAPPLPSSDPAPTARTASTFSSSTVHRSSLGLPTTRDPLNDSERAHILSVLDVSREALRRLEHRDRARDGRIVHLRQQIDTLQDLLSGGGTLRMPGTMLVSDDEGEHEARSVSVEVGSHEDRDGEPSMLPHSLLTGQVSLLRRRGAIHRPHPPSTSTSSSAVPPLPTTAPAPHAPARPLSYMPRPSQTLMDLLTPFHGSSTLGSSLHSPFRVPGSSLSTRPAATNITQDDSALPARVRPSHVQLLSQQFAAAGAARPAPPPSTSGVHRPLPGKPGWSTIASEDQQGTWKLWCGARSTRGKDSEMSLEERCLLLGPPWRRAGGIRGTGGGGQGCGALVVLKGAQKVQGRFVMSERGVGLGEWAEWDEEVVKRVEGEMGIGGLGCACVKKAVGCLNCGRVLGTYLDPSQPYHSHPLYTLSAERVSAKRIPSDPADPVSAFAPAADANANPSTSLAERRRSSIFSSTAFTLPPRTTRPPLRNRRRPTVLSDSDSEDAATVADIIRSATVLGDATSPAASGRSYDGPALARTARGPVPSAIFLGGIESPILQSSLARRAAAPASAASGLSYDEERLAAMRERNLASLEHLSQRLGTGSSFANQPSLSLTARVEAMLRETDGPLPMPALEPGPARRVEREGAPEPPELSPRRRERRPSSDEWVAISWENVHGPGVGASAGADDEIASDDSLDGTTIPGLVSARTRRAGERDTLLRRAREINARSASALHEPSREGHVEVAEREREERRDWLDLETLRGIRRRIMAAGVGGEKWAAGVEQGEGEGRRLVGR